MLEHQSESHPSEGTKPSLLCAESLDCSNGQSLAKNIIIGTRSSVLTKEISSGADQTRHFLSLLTNYTKDELVQVRQNFGIFLHKYLLQLVNQGYEGIVTADSLCIGMVGSTLTRNEGAGRYFKGSISWGGNEMLNSIHGRSFSSFSSPQLAVESHRNLLSHIESRELPGRLVIGVNGYLSGEHAGQITVFLGGPERVNVTSYRLDPGSSNPGLARILLMERATLACLHQLGLWLGRKLDLPNMPSYLSDLGQLAETRNKQWSYLSDATVKIQSMNVSAWKTLLPLMHRLNHQGIAVGESFTGGEVVSLLTSLEGSGRFLRFFNSFYDRAFKERIGVPSKNLEDDLIAEPETVIVAAERLKQAVSTPTQTVITTSGWANRWWDGKADFFSVALLDDFENREHTYSARVTVDISSGFMSSPERRELTRHLGVSVALLLLGKSLAARDSSVADFLRAPLEMIEVELKKYASLRLDQELRITGPSKLQGS